ncbi:MAG: terpene cyclase/mutase family protein [Planctomycetia bacterium]|nr:terpene cyclase/mutase family protein [Planctomycetia bacterium]
MLSYLEDITLRLAQGIDRLPEATRARHAEFLKSQQRPDGGFAGREGASDLYYTGFALRGLAMTGELHGPIAERAAEFLKTRLSGSAPIVDFLSLVYGGMLLEMSAEIDVFAAVHPDWRAQVSAAVERFRRADGGYAKTDEGQSSSTYHTFLVVICNQLIGRPIVEPARIVEFVRSRRRSDGGFVEIGPMTKSGTNPSAAAAALLRILDGYDDPTRTALADFLLDAQTDDGGFRANTRIPVADVLSTFTATLTLADLGLLGAIEVDAAREYVRSMELPGGGFLGGVWDSATDVEYTFYGLGATALLSLT